MKYAFRSTCLAAAFVALGIQAAQAQTYLTQTQTSITNLSYSVVDLDLSDGVTSSVVFQGPSYYGFSVAAEGPTDTMIFVEGPAPTYKLFGSNNFSVSSPNSTFSVDGANITATARMTASDAAIGLTTGPGGTSAPGYIVQGGATSWPSPGGYFSEEEFANLGNFVLAPHTSFVIEGTLDFQTVFNAQALDPALVSSITAIGGRVLAESGSYSRFVVELQGGTSDWHDLQSLQTLAVDAQGSEITGYSDIQGPTAFKLVVSNDTDEYKNGIFTYVLAATDTVRLDVASQVPEPGTLALHALGLMGLAAAVARQSKKVRS